MTTLTVSAVTKGARLARLAQVEAHHERSRADALAPCGNLDDVVETGGSRPFDELAHQLEFEWRLAGARGRVRVAIGQQRGQELGQRHVDVGAVVAVEDDALRVALVIAHPQVVAKRRLGGLTLTTEAAWPVDMEISLTSGSELER